MVISGLKTSSDKYEAGTDPGVELVIGVLGDTANNAQSAE